MSQPPILPVEEKMVRKTAFTGPGWIVFTFCGIPELYLLNITRLLAGERGGVFFMALIVGLLLPLSAAVVASRRTRFDADGIHVRGLWSAYDVPWPLSRSGLVVQRPIKNPIPGLLIMVFARLFIVVLVFLSDGSLALDRFPDMNLAARACILNAEGQIV